MTDHALLIAAICFALAEAVFYLGFSSTYFKIGIPIYRRRFRFAGDALHSDLPALEAEHSPGLLPPMAFRLLGEGVVAFREKVFSWSLVNYTPLMRGLIRVDPVRRTVETKGLVNYSVFIVMALLLRGFSNVTMPPEAKVVLAAAIAGSYLIQARRFSAIHRDLANAQARV